MIGDTQKVEGMFGVDEKIIFSELIDVIRNKWRKPPKLVNTPYIPAHGR